jgi:hypothetical protein
LKRTFATGLLSATILASSFGHSARAQEVVHDPLNFLELGLQLEQMIQTYQTLYQSYLQATYTAQALKHENPLSLTTAQGLLNNAVHMPGSPAPTMQDYNYGSKFSAYAHPFYYQNHVYTPDGDDFAAQEMRRHETATANLQGEAQTGAETTNQRIASLTELQASIAAQPDVTAVSAINARLASERLFLANEQAKNQHLQMMLATQDQVSRQRAEQHGRQQLDEWAAAVDAQAWGH